MSDQTPPEPPDDGDGPVHAAIEPIEIQEEMESSFLDYAMSVITARALPDARDGLKPVHRRILYGMDGLGARPDRSHMKCARITGDVMGKYHPHGEGAIYDSLVRMAQDFSLRHPLVDGHGNFGSPRLRPGCLALHRGAAEPAGDADARRHRRGHRRLQRQLLGRRRRARRCCPARFPNLLVNGSQGIAVGMATNIPPHNLGEVIDATVHLIDNPEATPDDLMQFVQGPDFPTGALIMGRQGIIDAYRTGKGSHPAAGRVRDRGGERPRRRPDRRHRDAVPDVDLRVARPASPSSCRRAQIEGISDVNDESARGKTRLVIKLKKDAPALVILNNLYKHTPLQTNFAVNTVALVDGIPRTLNLVQALQAYVDHQVEVIRRRSEFRLEKAQDRAHIVEGLLKAVDVIDAGHRPHPRRPRTAPPPASGSWPSRSSSATCRPSTSSTCGSASSPGSAKIDLETEMATLRETIGMLEAILGDETVLRTVIKNELAEVKEKFADERRSKITFDVGDMNIEDLIDDEELVVTLSAKGYIKTVLADSFRSQGRGGRGVAGAKLRDEDYVSHILTTTAHAYLLFFSNLGRVYRLKAHEIPKKERTARGTAMPNLLQLQPGEHIQTIIDTRDYETNRFLFFATKNGQVKKTKFNEYDSSLRTGIIAINLRDGDELVKVIPTNGGDDILMLSKLGQAIRFSRGRRAPDGPGRRRRARHEAARPATRS